jgi:hypothetical protein
MELQPKAANQRLAFQDALICQKRELLGSAVVDDPSTWGLLIFHVGRYRAIALKL